MERRKLQVEIDEICETAGLVEEVRLASTSTALEARCEAKLLELEEEFQRLEQLLHELDGKVFAIDSETLQIRRVKPHELTPLPPRAVP